MHNINAPSGLFVRRCSYCGLKSELFPLHLLIMVAFHLSIPGCQGETLFGVLACLVCLLHFGANPCFRADVSLAALVSTQESSDCQHEHLSPCEFAKRVIALLPPTLSSEMNTAWLVIYNSLRHSRRQWTTAQTSNQGDNHSDHDFSAFVDLSEDENESVEGADEDPALPIECYAIEEDHYHDYDHVTYFGESTILGPLWAAIQTELLTYRRLNVGDCWISDNFSMSAVLDGLRNDGSITMPLIDKAMMKPYCACGRFVGPDPASTTIDDAAAYYFGNLEDYKRSSFLHSVKGR